jgi:acyl-coenzyme A synthetase/AMP-(fatty) acid ligase
MMASPVPGDETRRALRFRSRIPCFVDEFPMTMTGKMQKYLMREAMARELGGEQTAAE